MTPQRGPGGPLSLITRNVVTKVISVGIALILWMVVFGSRTVEGTKEVALEIQTDPDVTVANDVPEKISFRLAGPQAFLRAVLDRREDPIRINLTGNRPGLVTYRFFSDNIRVPIGVKVLTINPTAVLVKLEAVRKREVPVRLELRGVPAEGYRIQRSEVRPATVRLRGAESRVEMLSEIQTVPLDVAGLRQGFTREVQLDLGRRGIAVDGEMPVARVEIGASQPNYRIKNVELRVQSAFRATVTPKTVTVLVRVNPEDLRLLDRSRVFAEVDLRGRPRGRHEASVDVRLPEAVGLVRVVPDRVTVNLE